MDQTRSGLIASPGIAMGKAKLFKKQQLSIAETTIESKQIEAEQKRLKEVFERYYAVLEGRKGGNEAQSSVVEAHMELLSDPYFLESASKLVEEDLKNAAWALKETSDGMIQMMEGLEDPYLRERGADYRDIAQNLQYLLAGITPADLSSLSEDCIIVAEELTPSDTSTMDKRHVLGFVNDFGGKTSHVAIIAQTLGIPALVGMKDISQQVQEGDFLILDGAEGMLWINPDQETCALYEDRLKNQEQERKRLEAVKDALPITQDGHKVEVVCNVGNLDDLSLGLTSGAQGVGLFRTEFLYMDNDHFPTEEEQFVVYKEAAERLNGYPLLIRTLDIGGDKGLSYFEFPREENPFLGWRAIRVCFDQLDVFKTQIRAIVRASAFGNVKLFLPMVISVEEFLKARALVDEIMEELDQASIAFDHEMEMGIMVETPASVLLAEDLAHEADFFSIGTNDLTQYLLAVDRGNEKIAELYNSYHPAVLRAIKTVIDAAHGAGKWCGMCGGFASDPQATYLLLGMGLDEFSVVGSRVAKVKDLIRNARYEDAQAFAERILACSNETDIGKLIQMNDHQ